MAVLTYPLHIPIEKVGYWYLKTVSQTFRKQMQGGGQTVEMPGARWVLQLVYSKLIEDEWREMSAFLASMRGQSGRAYVSHPHVRKPRGIATGHPVVVASDGNLLSTSGWTASTAGILKNGDLLHFDTPAGRELKLVIGNVDSDAAGFATIKVEAPIRTAPNAGAVIVTDSPSCIMGLKDDDQSKAAFVDHKKGSFSVELVEEWEFDE